MLILKLLLLITSTKAASIRRQRFPSVEERVRLYASNWYQPPCNDILKINFLSRSTGEELSTFQISNTTFGIDVIPDQAFLLERSILEDCARGGEDNATLPTSHHIQFRHNMRMYCVDAMEILNLADYHLLLLDIPILIQFGDSKSSHVYGMIGFPHFKKFRPASGSKKALAKATSSCKRRPLDTVHSKGLMQPIVWKLATDRHYRQLPDIYRYDTPWSQKRDVAIFRGKLTGTRDVYDKHREAITNCREIHRCRLVLETNSSEIVDAKLTTTKNRLPDTIQGVQLVGSTLTIRELMRYKVIIMLEGNDVASGLKWALLSQSVVLMPPAQHTSWCMEELLEPWVHYVPLKKDVSDVEQKMRWVLEHDKEAKQISRRGTLWMEDLIFHPDAAREERLIKEELIRRYFSHFIESKERNDRKN